MKTKVKRDKAKQPSVWALLGIRNDDGIIESVQKCQDYIVQGEDVNERLDRANTVIKSVGGRPMQDPDAARIIAKYMLGQVVEKKTPDQELALQRCHSLIHDHPYIQREKINVTPSPRKVKSAYKPKTARRKGANNDLRTKALEYCAKHAKKTNAELAQEISKLLKISYANAYYYASRVFKR